MKKVFLLVTFFGLIHSTAIRAQTKTVNEECSATPCEEGLFCVETKDGKKKCATCDQSRLETMTGDVDNYCKAFGQGWTPSSSQDYQDALAADGRVLVDVFDIMLENAKKCKKARVDREHECWRDGDDEHKKAIEQVGESIERIAAHKQKMIGDRRVYYGSKSTYESRLSTFKSKSSLDFPNIDQKLSIAENDLKDGKKIDCSDIEKYSNDCEHCVDAGKDLLNDGFSNRADRFPDEYNDILTKAQELFKRAKDILEAAKSKELCN
jgi:hypothetical protein